MIPDRVFTEPKSTRKDALFGLPVDLVQYVRDEAERRAKLGLPNALVWQVVADALWQHKHRHRVSKWVYYLNDGRGPFYSTHEVLDALGVPKLSRGKYWHRWDRLPQEYRALIERREPDPQGELALAEVDGKVLRGETARLGDRWKRELEPAGVA